jgi:hypothetical protein
VDNEAYRGFDSDKFIAQIGAIERALFGRMLPIGERGP